MDRGLSLIVRRSAANRQMFCVRLCRDWEIEFLKHPGSLKSVHRLRRTIVSKSRVRWRTQTQPVLVVLEWLQQAGWGRAPILRKFLDVLCSFSELRQPISIKISVLEQAESLLFKKYRFCRANNILWIQTCICKKKIFFTDPWYTNEAPL